MKAKNLIKHLQDLDPETEIIVSDMYGHFQKEISIGISRY